MEEEGLEGVHWKNIEALSIFLINPINLFYINFWTDFENTENTLVDAYFRNLLRIKVQSFLTASQLKCLHTLSEQVFRMNKVLQFPNHLCSPLLDSLPKLGISLLCQEAQNRTQCFRWGLTRTELRGRITCPRPAGLMHPRYDTVVFLGHLCTK